MRLLLWSWSFFLTQQLFQYKVLLQWVHLVFCCRSSRTLYSTRWCQVLHLLQCLLTHQHCQWTHQGQNLWLRLSGMNQWYWHNPLQKDIHMFMENRMLSWNIVDISVQHCGVMINFVKIFVNNSRKWQVMFHLNLSHHFFEHICLRVFRLFCLIRSFLQVLSPQWKSTKSVPLGANYPIFVMRFTISNAISPSHFIRLSWIGHHIPLLIEAFWQCSSSP